MNESFHSEATNDMVIQINWRLKAYTMRMREEFSKSKDLKKVALLKEQALEDVYNILVKALGKPPKKFVYEYTDKDKKFVRLDEQSPKEFYEKYVGDFIDNKVDLVADPRPAQPKNRLIVSKDTKNMVNGQPLEMVNVSIEDLKKAMIEQLKAGESVWFGCDVSTFLASKEGILDPKVFNYDLTLTKTPEFSKEEKFLSRASVISHAMNMVGVNLDNNGKPLSWKVENSWGEDLGKKGFFSMSDEWFTEYNYMAIVDKKYLSKEILEAYDKEVIEISPFDPLCEE
ncbi:aminopeptidase C [Mycoplasma struthionis]|uniref:aminopeptidase C n=1 Tax=Mycoplasma struthionis TaxID=538220 RepID=UPI0021BD500E|nr:C1 family peptidase [Mycoplasma struthionis]